MTVPKRPRVTQTLEANQLVSRSCRMSSGFSPLEARQARRPHQTVVRTNTPKVTRVTWVESPCSTYPDQPRRARMTSPMASMQTNSDHCRNRCLPRILSPNVKGHYGQLTGGREESKA